MAAAVQRMEFENRSQSTEAARKEESAAVVAAESETRKE